MFSREQQVRCVRPPPLILIGRPTPEMEPNFIIEDEAHAEQHSSHATFADAVAELHRLAEIPWDQEPNLAPCTSWRRAFRPLRTRLR